MPISPGAVQAGGAYVTINALDDTEKTLNRVDRRLNRFAQSLATIGRNLALVGVTAGIGFGLSLKTFAEFDDSMRTVRAVTGATEKQFKELTETAKELGRTTSFTARQIAAGMVALGRNVPNPEDVNRLIGPIQNLARATGVELNQAAQIGLDTLRAFKLPISDAARVIDTLTSTANNSSQSIEELFESMKLIGPLANLTGTSLEEAAAASAVLANSGIKASLAGTALRRAMVNLSQTDIQGKLREIGIEVGNANGDFKKLIHILNDIGVAANNLPQIERLGLFEEIFGIRGLVAATNLSSATEQYDALLETIKKSSGTAAKVAADMDAGVGGAFRRLLSAFEGLKIAFGEAIAGPMQEMSGAFARITRTAISFIESNKEIAGIAVASSAALVGLGVSTIGLAVGLKSLGIVLGTVAGAMTIVRTNAIALVAMFNLGRAGAIAYAAAFSVLRGAMVATASISGALSAAFLSMAFISANVTIAIRGLSATFIALVGAIRSAVAISVVAVGAYRSLSITIGGLTVVVSAAMTAFGTAGFTIRAFGASVVATTSSLAAMKAIFKSLGVVTLAATAAMKGAKALAIASATAFASYKAAVVTVVATTKLFTGAMIAATAAMRIVQSSMLAMRTAMVGLQVVLPVMGLLFSPAGLIVAGALAASVAIAALSDTAGDLKRDLTDFENATMPAPPTADWNKAFSDMAETARKTVGGIMAAMEGGDFELAGVIAMKGLRLAFLQGMKAVANHFGMTLDEMGKAFGGWIDNIRKGFLDFSTFLQKVGIGLGVAVNTALVGWEEANTEGQQALKDADEQYNKSKKQIENSSATDALRKLFGGYDINALALDLQADIAEAERKKRIKKNLGRPIWLAEWINEAVDRARAAIDVAKMDQLGGGAGLLGEATDLGLGTFSGAAAGRISGDGEVKKVIKRLDDIKNLSIERNWQLNELNRLIENNQGITFV